jgi:outer membrane protein
MKKIVCIFAVLLLFSGQLASAEDFKVGLVDLVKAITESDTGKKAKAELEFFAKSKEAVINEKGQAIEKLRRDFEKQVSILSDEAKKAKEDELQRLIRDYQRMVTDTQNELRKKESDLTNDIIKDLRVIIQEIGDKEGYTMILDYADGLVLYSKTALNITDQVIKQYNETKGKAKK